MARMQKQKLVIFPDINLVGLFIKAEQKSNDPEYLYIYYKPLADGFRVKPPRTEKYPSPIHRENVFTHMGSKTVAGVEPEVVYVQTEEPGGFLQTLVRDKDRRIRELREEIEYYKSQATRASADAENANANLSHRMAEVDNFKSRRSPAAAGFPAAPVFNRIGRQEGYQDSEEYQDFDDR